MGKNTSISLGDHFEDYVASQVEAGRFGNRSEVIGDACATTKRSSARSKRCGRR